MLHLIPSPAPEPQPQPQPYAEAVARLASIRHALRLVDPYGGGPAPDTDDAVAAAWDGAPHTRRQRFDARSAQLVAATAAGVEALLDERQAGREPNQEASQALVEQIRRELAAVSTLILT